VTRHGQFGWALGLVALLLPAALPSSARAWTDAQVHGADADVTMSRDGRAEVTLTLSLRVRGGWLEGLEVAGLEPDAELLEDPRMVSIPAEGETMERFHPRARVREPRADDPDARIQLSFHRRESPRRGRYRIFLRYATSLGERLMPHEDGDGWKGEWTLPAWRSGLDGVTITLRLPAGARFDPDAPPRALVERERFDEGGMTVLRWDRAHLPRTTAWPLRFELPANALTPALAERLRVGAPESDAVTPSAPATTDGDQEVPAPTAAPTPSPWRLPSWLALALALAMLGTGALFEREARRRRARPRPLVGPPVARVSLMGPLVAGGWPCSPRSWSWAGSARRSRPHRSPVAGRLCRRGPPSPPARP
jgi:hypothetical protein